MRARIMNQLHVIARNEGVRRKKELCERKGETNWMLEMAIFRKWLYDQMTTRGPQC